MKDGVLQCTTNYSNSHYPSRFAAKEWQEQEEHFWDGEQEGTLLICHSVVAVRSCLYLDTLISFL
jgi:hypothetical protein